MHHCGCFRPPPISRRQMLVRCGGGLGAIALAALLNDAAGARTPANAGAVAKQPHYRPKARSIIFLYMDGGVSQMDSFDPKPRLEREHGQPFKMKIEATQFNNNGNTLKSPWRFRQYGQSGIPVSELFPRVAECVDDLAVIRSMHADVPNHEPSLLLMNCGEARLIRPSVGSWVTYGLGTENQNLPGFIAMCPGGYPIKETENWQSAFLPGAYQGTYIDSSHTDIDKLIANIRNSNLSPVQ